MPIGFGAERAGVPPHMPCMRISVHVVTQATAVAEFAVHVRSGRPPSQFHPCGPGVQRHPIGDQPHDHPAGRADRRQAVSPGADRRRADGRRPAAVRRGRRRVSADRDRARRHQGALRRGRHGYAVGVVCLFDALVHAALRSLPRSLPRDRPALPARARRAERAGGGCRLRRALQSTLQRRAAELGADGRGGAAGVQPLLSRRVRQLWTAARTCAATRSRISSILRGCRGTGIFRRSAIRLRSAAAA